MSKKKKQDHSRKKSKSDLTPDVKPDSTPSVAEHQIPAYMLRRPAKSQQDPLYKKIFYGLGFVILLLMLVMAWNSGMNSDESFQVDYSSKLVQFYTTMGKDTSALYVEDGQMHYYGGFFDLTAGLINKALGFDEYDRAYHGVRHLLVALLGFLAIFFTALLGREIGGWRVGLLTLVLMFFSARFLGHSLMNPKDIPFSAGFCIALLYMVRLLAKMPTIDWKAALGLSLGIGLAFGTRAGGLLLVTYLVLFAALDFILKYGVRNMLRHGKVVAKYLGAILAVSIAAYLLGILTWPAALVDPLNHPMEALREFSKLGIKIRVQFMGLNIMSDDTPWYYLLVWLFKTVPLYTLVGFVGSLVLLPVFLKRFSVIPIVLVYFASIFPVAYVIYKDSLLYDGWRHLLFVYPTILLMASLFWVVLESFFVNNRNGRFGIWLILGLMILESAIFIVRNPQFPYLYFNPIGGGLYGAYGYYETDYWGVSIKQAIQWMEREGILHENMEQPITLATTFFYNVDRTLKSAYRHKVNVEYVRINRRYTVDWDYAIFPSRFVRGAHIRAGTWPESKTIHAVVANGVPLTAVLKKEDDFAYQAEQAVNNEDWAKAVEYFSKELERYPDNELAWMGLSNAYIRMGNYEEAIDAADRALRIAPQSENGLYFAALAHLQLGNIEQARQLFIETIIVNDDYHLAYYYLAVIEMQYQNLEDALQFSIRALRINPKFKAAYELTAALYEKMGQPEKAARYLEAIKKF